MKIQKLSLSVFMAVICMSFVVSAQDGDRVPPCMQIKKACENAGFQKGKARDCMKKVTSGEKVLGVSINADVVSQCKEKHEK